MKSTALLAATCLTCLLAAGCRGPLGVPMVDRLDEERQAQVDDAWLNVFMASDQVERTLLLDAILCGQLHHRGVDTLHLVSEKHVGDGLVLMEVHFQQDNPDADEFAITFFDAAGWPLRRERFTREDVQARVSFFCQAAMQVEDAPPEVQAEMELQKAEYEARMEEIYTLLAPMLDNDEEEHPETAPED
ncbi:MAG: hypothetical protein PVJ57_20370 [Phycisphaerae bacterium]|jgi:hypothetical protein